MVTQTSPANADRNRAIAMAPGNLAPSFFYDWHRSRLEQASASAAVLLLHATAIALVIFSRPVSPVGEKPGLLTFDITTGGERKPHRKMSHPPHARGAAPMPATPASLVQVARIDPAQGLPDPSPTVAAQALAMPAVVGGGCDLVQPVQDALRHSDDVRRQLPAIPADSRSVANAIVVWNAGWINPETAPSAAALATIRQTISQAVAAASADCRNQLQLGPRLVYLPGANTNVGGASGKTLVLALGSGQWTWQQLIDGNQPLPINKPGSSGAALAANMPPPAPFATVQQAAALPSQTTAVDALLATLIRNRSTTVYP